MSPRDTAKYVKAVPSVSPDVISTTVNGAVVDTIGFDEAMIILDCGVLAATATLDVKIQEDDNLAFASPTDITGAAFTQKLTGDSSKLFVGRVLLEGSRQRFIRAVAVQAVAAVDAGVSIVLMSALNRPAQTPEFDVTS